MFRIDRKQTIIAGFLTLLVLFSLLVLKLKQSDRGATGANLAYELSLLNDQSEILDSISISLESALGNSRKELQSSNHAALKDSLAKVPSF